MLYCESDKECHDMLLRESTEIAKQEAVTVHKGGQTGNQNAAKDKTNNRITINRSRNHPDTNQGILRRLAKQGRDDLLERVAIAKAIEEEIGNRQGKRTDLEPVGDCPQVTADKTRAIAAEKAGFGTVVAVVENHTPKSGMTFAVELNGVHRKIRANPKAAYFLRS